MPKFEYYTGCDGGYVAVYTTRPSRSSYSVGDGIHVIGFMRVQGAYFGRIFYPTGYRPGDDITKDRQILAAWENQYPEWKGLVWIGGDTVGYVTWQPR